VDNVHVVSIIKEVININCCLLASRLILLLAGLIIFGALHTATAFSTPCAPYEEGCAPGVQCYLAGSSDQEDGQPHWISTPCWNDNGEVVGQCQVYVQSHHCIYVTVVCPGINGKPAIHRYDQILQVGQCDENCTRFPTIGRLLNVQMYDNVCYPQG
jgi:hypothetical protein